MRADEIGACLDYAFDLGQHRLVVGCRNEALELGFRLVERFLEGAFLRSRLLEDVLEPVALIGREAELTSILLRIPPLGRVGVLAGRPWDGEHRDQEQEEDAESPEDSRLHGSLPVNTSGSSGDVYCKGCKHIR